MKIKNFLIKVKQKQIVANNPFIFVFHCSGLTNLQWRHLKHLLHNTFRQAAPSTDTSFSDVAVYPKKAANESTNAAMGGTWGDVGCEATSDRRSLSVFAASDARTPKDKCPPVPFGRTGTNVPASVRTSDRQLLTASSTSTEGNSFFQRGGLLPPLTSVLWRLRRVVRLRPGAIKLGVVNANRKSQCGRPGIYGGLLRRVGAPWGRLGRRRRPANASSRVSCRPALPIGRCANAPFSFSGQANYLIGGERNAVLRSLSVASPQGSPIAERPDGRTNDLKGALAQRTLSSDTSRSPRDACVARETLLVHGLTTSRVLKHKKKSVDSLTTKSARARGTSLLLGLRSPVPQKKKVGSLSLNKKYITATLKRFAKNKTASRDLVGYMPGRKAYANVINTKLLAAFQSFVKTKQPELLQEHTSLPIGLRAAVRYQGSLSVACPSDGGTSVPVHPDALPSVSRSRFVDRRSRRLLRPLGQATHRERDPGHPSVYSSFPSKTKVNKDYKQPGPFCVLYSTHNTIDKSTAPWSDLLTNINNSFEYKANLVLLYGHINSNQLVNHIDVKESISLDRKNVLSLFLQSLNFSTQYFDVCLNTNKTALSSSGDRLSTPLQPSSCGTDLK